jgi:7,8-dihydropterin-6-yl-methyl-4-(beta-D-ribofuranosyl)aminobenzene 5'-phosphate synthase
MQKTARRKGNSAMTCYVGSARIVILVDDKAKQGLTAEHGFSAWIEGAGRRILFDTGQGPALAGNVDKLGVALRSTDVLVLSHGHYDHTGGVTRVVENAPAVHVYCHPGAKIPRYSICDGVARAIGLPNASGLALAGLSPERMHFTEAAIEIAPGVGLTGPIPRHTEYEDVGGPFFADVEEKHADGIDDDQALWIRTRKGLVVVTGCGHAGIVNTLGQALRTSGASRIHAVLGGFHLREASETRIERTIAALQNLAPDMIVPCHCTGDHAVEALRKALGECVRRGTAGDAFTFGD